MTNTPTISVLDAVHEPNDISKHIHNGQGLQGVDAMGKLHHVETVGMVTQQHVIGQLTLGRTSSIFTFREERSHLSFCFRRRFLPFWSKLSYGQYADLPSLVKLSLVSQVTLLKYRLSKMNQERERERERERESEADRPTERGGFF